MKTTIDETKPKLTESKQPYESFLAQKLLDHYMSQMDLSAKLREVYNILQFKDKVFIELKWDDPEFKITVDPQGKKWKEYYEKPFNIN